MYWRSTQLLVLVREFLQIVKEFYNVSSCKLLVTGQPDQSMYNIMFSYHD
jgi:hypothetical protein